MIDDPISQRKTRTTNESGDRVLCSTDIIRLADRLKQIGVYGIGQYFGGEFCCHLELSDAALSTIQHALRSYSDDLAGKRRP